MEDGNWVDRKNDDLKQSDQAWINDRSWMEREPGRWARGKEYSHYKENGLFGKGLLGLMARHPMLSSVVVMLLGGLFMVIFSLIYF